MAKIKLLFLLSFCALVSAHQELTNLLLQQQEDLKLSSAETEALRPLYRELQAQYDYIYSQSLQLGDGSAKPDEMVQPELDDNYQQVFMEFRKQFSKYLDDQPRVVYDTTLPTLEELIGPSSADMSEEQQAELEDLRAILQDVLDEAEMGIDTLVKRAIELETNLLTLNKPKIVEAAIGGLGFMWTYWGRAAQAAYCSYSHVPEFQVALQAVNDGVDCYSYTMALILSIQDETVSSVKEIKKNVLGLVKVYKKIAAKKTLVGKILSGTVNVFSAIRRVHDIIAVGISGYDKISNELPGAAHKSAQCGVEFINSIPHMIETAQNLTKCITYVDTDKPEYEFVRPEEERYWNTGADPPEIPHENDEGDGDDDDDDDMDDYVDHR